MLYLLSNLWVQATLTAELHLVLLFISVLVVTITVITVLCYTEVVVFQGFVLCLSLNFCLVVIVVAVLEVFGLLLVLDSFCFEGDFSDVKVYFWTYYLSLGSSGSRWMRA